MIKFYKYLSDDNIKIINENKYFIYTLLHIILLSFILDLVNYGFICFLFVPFSEKKCPIIAHFFLIVYFIVNIIFFYNFKYENNFNYEISEKSKYYIFFEFAINWINERYPIIDKYIVTEIVTFVLQYICKFLIDICKFYLVSIILNYYEKEFIFKNVKIYNIIIKILYNISVICFLSLSALVSLKRQGLFEN